MKRIFLLIPILLLLSCKEDLIRNTRPVLGTFGTITVAAANEKSSAAINAAFEEISRIENLMSPYRKGSDVERINSGAAENPVKIRKETFVLIQKAVEFSKKSGGAFDVTFASIGFLWNFRTSDFTPPDNGEVEKHLFLVDYRNMVLDTINRRIRFLHRGMRIGLGGIAKGHAIKRAVEILQSHGIKSGIVEIGGDLQVMGTKAGEPWITGLINPRNRKEIILTIKLADGDAITTSGDYERFAIYKKKRYHHILSPRTGYPAESFSSVTVISKDPVVSDALSTAIFVMGEDEAARFVKSQKGIYVILIDKKGRLSISNSLKDKVGLLKKSSVQWI